MKKQITIKHLLTMSAGLGWNENVSYADPSNREISMYNSPDPIEYVLNQKLSETPGKKFNYSGGCTHILAAIVEKATGIAIDKFTEKYLFKPLRIAEYDWLKTNNGVTIVPQQLNDGIKTATLKEVVIDEKLINAMTDSITNGNYQITLSGFVLRQ